MRWPEGSPPRGRGRQPFKLAPHGRVGLTPAWAGTAELGSAQLAMCRAHPRVGGDGSTTRWRTLLTWGSPPRGRGRLAGSAALLRGRGLTPAWAGTAPCAHAATRSAWAHPRVGGDGFRPDETDLYAKGSPPRGRGRLAELSGCRPGSGLTPAWAGTAPRFGPRFPGLRAHPRVGGDGSSMAVRSERCRGSPPRGRGRRWADHFYPDRGGLTPAWAGTAAIGHRVCPFLGAHPRVGGDGGDPKAGIGARQGSPPRGRGRPSSPTIRAAGGGLTPAWAGTATLGETP